MRRSRRPCLGLVVGVFVAQLLGCRTEIPEAPARRSAHQDFQNLIVLTIDTLRSDHLPSYGYSRNTSPCLAKIAGEGIQIQGYSASSWTRSSMATLFTGLYPQRHNTVGRKDRLPESTPFLAEILQSLGFYTAAFVTNGNVSTEFGFRRGYDHYEELLKTDTSRAGHVVDEVLEAAPSFVEPYYLYVHFIEPHDPYTPKAAWDRTPDRPNRYLQPQGFFRKEYTLTEESLGSLVNQYDGEILELDEQLDRLMTSLPEKLLEKTLVVVTADHGEEFGEHGSLAHGATLYGEVVEVPLIFWARSGLRPYRSQVAFHQVDFMATALDALGVVPPTGIDGRSRWDELRDDRLESRSELFFHLDLDGNTAVAIQTPRYKLVQEKKKSESRLYDLRESPRETVPSQTNEVRGELTKELREFDRDMRSRRYEREEAGAIDDEVKRQLENLGYLGRGDKQE